MTRETFSSAEDAVSTLQALLAEQASRHLVRGQPHAIDQDGAGAARPHVLHPDVRKGHRSFDDSGLAIHVGTNNHHQVYYRADGVTVGHLLTEGGMAHHTADHIHSAAAVSATGTLTPPYWRRLHNPSPPLGATYPHEEVFYDNNDGFGQRLIAWHGFDSHGLTFFDATHFQFNPVGSAPDANGRTSASSIQFPDDHSIHTYLAVGNTADPAHAPSVTHPAAGSALAGGSYIILLSFDTPQGPTNAGPSVTVTISAGDNLVISVNAADLVSGHLPLGATGFSAYQVLVPHLRLLGRGVGNGTTSITVSSGPNLVTEGPTFNYSGIDPHIAAAHPGGGLCWSHDGQSFRVYTNAGLFLFFDNKIMFPNGAILDGDTLA